MGSKERLFTNITAASNEVTGSSISFETRFPNQEMNRYVTDCGIFQESQYSDLNEEVTYNPKTIDGFFITHAHADHIGKLPFMEKNGYSNPIYATDVTCQFMRPSLMDGARVLRERAKKLGKKALYNEGNVGKTMTLCKPCLFDKTYQVDDYTKVTFFKNGHLIGSSLILAQIGCPGIENINILFTGDYDYQNTFFDVPKLPNWVYELPITIVQDATYGDMNSCMVKKSFRENVQKAIAEGKTVVILVFSLGRSQEIMYELKDMQDLGDLSTEVPVYYDGRLSQEYTYMFENFNIGIKEEMKDFLPRNLTYVCKFNRLKVLKGLEKKIIVTTAGMGSYGPAQLYIPEYIRRKNALIHFTGYSAEGTLGRKLQECEDEEYIQIGGAIVKKRASVEYTLEFSKHNKADDKIKFLKPFKRINTVLLNHSARLVNETYAKRVMNEVNTKQVAILDRNNLFRINPYGLVKTVPRN